MKYIVTKQPDGTEEIFIFPKAVHHKDMAEAVGYLKDHARDGSTWRRLERDPISAGFVEGGKCVGNSESLMLASRPEDTALLPWVNVKVVAPRQGDAAESETEPLVGGCPPTTCSPS